MPEKNGSQNTDTGTQPGNQAEASDNETKPKLFTQEDLDRQIGERLQRERNKYADYTDLKKAADELKSIKDAQKSELEKLQEQAASAIQRAERAEQERQNALITAAAMAALGQRVPADRLRAAFKLLDKSELKLQASGEVENLEAAIEAMLKDNPFIASKAEQPAPNKQTPQLGATNPGGGSPPSDVRAWHPLYRGTNPGWKGKPPSSSEER